MALSPSRLRPAPAVRRSGRPAVTEKSRAFLSSRDCRTRWCAQAAGCGRSEGGRSVPMNTTTSSTSTASTCAMCGRALDEDHPVHDATGHPYCHSCLEHLYGHHTHARAVPIACGLCGELVDPATFGFHAGAKGRYCPDCVARLRGQPRSRRTVEAPPAARDVAFDQMLADVFSPAGSAAMA
jgi:hypothetical protein